MVFIPDTPTRNSGAVLVVGTDRVKQLNIPYAKLLDNVRNYGHGSEAVKNAPRNGVQNDRDKTQGRMRKPLRLPWNDTGTSATPPTNTRMPR